MSRRWFAAGLVAALSVTLLFLVLPVVAIFVDTGPVDLLSSLGDEGALEALRLSLLCSTAAVALIVVVGTPAAYFLATRRFRGRATVVTLDRAAARAAAGGRGDRAAGGVRPAGPAGRQAQSACSPPPA